MINYQPTYIGVDMAAWHHALSDEGVLYRQQLAIYHNHLAWRGEQERRILMSALAERGLCGLFDAIRSLGPESSDRRN